MAVAVQPSSAANLLALLKEDDDSLKLYALQSLNKVVHEFWFQIASAIANVEAFYEDEDFSHRELAALVASKVCLLAGRSAREMCQCRHAPDVLKKPNMTSFADAFAKHHLICRCSTILASWTTLSHMLSELASSSTSMSHPSTCRPHWVSRSCTSRVVMCA